MDNGFVKIHRKIWSNPAVTKDNDHLAVWVWLLTNACFKPKKVDFAGKIITLEPGQLTCGRKKIAKGCQVNESKVERILKLFKSEQQIEQQTNNKCRLITINNWIEYQSVEQPLHSTFVKNSELRKYNLPKNAQQKTQNTPHKDLNKEGLTFESEQQVNNKRTTSEQQVNTKEEGKEYKEGNINTCANFDRFWSAYPKKRDKAKAQKAWAKIKESDHDVIFQALEAHKLCDDWRRDAGRFIPYPATWLNGERWNDDLKTEYRQQNYSYDTKQTPEDEPGWVELN